MKVASWDKDDSFRMNANQVQVSSEWNYVDDQLCALCHHKIYDSYQETGMAQSFRDPNNNRSIEDFTTEPFYHESTHTYFKIEKRDTQLFYMQFQKDAEAKRYLRHGLTMVSNPESIREQAKNLSIVFD